MARMVVVFVIQVVAAHEFDITSWEMLLLQIKKMCKEGAYWGKYVTLLHIKTSHFLFEFYQIILVFLDNYCCLFIA